MHILNWDFSHKSAIKKVNTHSANNCAIRKITLLCHRHTYSAQLTHWKIPAVPSIIPSSSSNVVYDGEQGRTLAVRGVWKSKRDRSEEGLIRITTIVNISGIKLEITGTKISFKDFTKTMMINKSLQTSGKIILKLSPPPPLVYGPGNTVILYLR